MKLKETTIHNMTYSLRDYQEIGKNELFLSNSFLLADDMGLGKTVQAISALKTRFEQNGHHAPEAFAQPGTFAPSNQSPRHH